MNNYKYPNGLVCAVSERRIKLFEFIVPPVLAVLLLTGIILIPASAYNSIGTYNAIPIALFGIILWALVVAGVFGIVFKIWCKPLDDISEDNKPT